MAIFVDVGELDINVFPQAEPLFLEHGFVFVEVDEGDWGLPRRVDFGTLYTAQQLIELAEAENLYVYVLVDDEDEAGIEAFTNAGWQDESRSAYWRNSRLFLREDQ